MNEYFLNMPKFLRIAAITCAVCAASAVNSALANPHVSAGNYANYWLLIHVTSTEPNIESAEGVDVETFSKRVLDDYGLTTQTMDDAPISTKMKVLDHVKATFSEGETIEIKALPMPSREVCTAAGDLSIERLSLPSMMTMARYTCISGR